MFSLELAIVLQAHLQEPAGKVPTKARSNAQICNSPSITMVLTPKFGMELPIHLAIQLPIILSHLMGIYQILN